MLGFGCDLVITAEQMHHICLGSIVAAVAVCVRNASWSSHMSSDKFNDHIALWSISDFALSLLRENDNA